MSNVGNCRACNLAFVNGGGTCDTCIRLVIAQRDAHLAAILAATVAPNALTAIAQLRTYLAGQS